MWLRVTESGEGEILATHGSFLFAAVRLLLNNTSFQTVNTSGDEPFTATNLSGTCTASQTGVTGSTTITGLPRN